MAAVPDCDGLAINRERYIIEFNVSVYCGGTRCGGGCCSICFYKIYCSPFSQKASLVISSL